MTMPKFTIIRHFNSHAHVERDYISGGCGLRHGHFNSHAHVERDGKTYAVCEQEINFNSHAHVERDNAFTHF